MKQINNLYLAAIVVIMAGWYNENIGANVKILITIFAIIVFILLLIKDHKEHLSRQKKAKEIKQKEQQKHEEVKRNI